MFGAVVLLCLAALRSWRAVVVALLPVVVVTVLCEAFMAWRGIGMTISTLPVIALGVGIPDFALYLLSVQLAHQRAGAAARRGPPALAALHRAGGGAGGDHAGRRRRHLVLVAIRLQSVMGAPLTFMFLGNMVAALVLDPGALAPPAGRGPARHEVALRTVRCHRPAGRP